LKKIDIIVADDHKLFRKGVVSLLRSFSRIGDIREAENGRDLLKKIQSKPPGVILMDLRMPVMDGIDASSFVLTNYPSVKILILTMYDNEKFMMHMIEMGIHGYLLKNAEPNEVEKAIVAVIENDFYYNKMVTDVLRKKVIKSSAKKPAFKSDIKLTYREQEILNLICKELTNHEIAEKLSISRRTVEKIRSNLLTKVNAKNTVGLVRYAINHGIFV